MTSQSLFFPSKKYGVERAISNLTFIKCQNYYHKQVQMGLTWCWNFHQNKAIKYIKINGLALLIHNKKEWKQQPEVAFNNITLLIH